MIQKELAMENNFYLKHFMSDIIFWRNNEQNA